MWSYSNKNLQFNDCGESIEVYMIRLIILFAIFLAVYPMIGDGWAQFNNDFNLTGMYDWVVNTYESLKR